MAPKPTAKKVKPSPPADPVIDPALVPDLLGQDSTPADTTLYLKTKINLSGQADKTAVFVPDRSRLAPPTVDVILYLHGHKANFRQGKKSIDIEQQLKLTSANGGLIYGIREAIAQSSKKRFVFVAPTLGDYSEGGDLIDKRTGKGDPKGFLSEVVKGVSHHLLKKQLGVGKVILAAHSGGGVAMRQLAAHAGIKSLVKEVWCFDCLYGGYVDIKFWKNWVTTTGGKLYVYSTGGAWVKIDKKRPLTDDNKQWADLTLTESQTIKKDMSKNPNVSVEISSRGLGHNAVPAGVIKMLIDQSKNLS